MADRFSVVTHVRRFDVQGEQRFLTAARAIGRADQARLRISVQANAATRAGTRAAEQHARAQQNDARASRTAAGGYNRAEREIEQLTRARERDIIVAARQQQQARTSAAAAARANTRAARSGSAGVVAAGAAGGAAGSRAGIAGAVGGAVAAVGLAAAVRDAARYEAALRDTGAVANVSGRELEKLGKTARTVGLQTAAGATEAAKAAGELVKGGIAIKDVNEGALKAALELGRAGGVEMEEAANTMARAISTFQLSGDQASHVGDLFANAANATTSSVRDLVFAFQQGSAAAKIVGYDIDETMLALATLSKAGLQNSDAGTSLKSALIQLNAPSKQAKETIEKYNLELYDQQKNFKGVAALADEFNTKLAGLNRQQTVTALKSLAGTDGFRALSAVMSTGEKGALKLGEAIQKEGEAHRIANERLKGAEGAMRRFAAARQEVSNLVGLPLLKPFERAATGAVAMLQDPGVRRGFRDLGDYFGQQGDALAESFEKALADGTIEKDIDALVGALKTVGTVMGSVAQIVGTANKAFTALPEVIREAGTAFLVYAGAARVAAAVTGTTFTGGVAAALGMRGRGRGAAAPAGGAPGVRNGFGGPIILPGSRSAAGGPAAPTTQAQRRAAMFQAQADARAATATRVAAQQQAAAASAAAARQAQQAASLRALGMPAAIAGPSLLTRSHAAQATLARAQAVEQARQQAAAQAARDASLRGRLANMNRPTGRGVAGVAAAGGIAGAMSGGNVLMGAAAGAAFGSMMGPAGAVGGAIVGAASTGLVKFFQNKGKEEAKKLGDEIANGLGRGQDAGRQKRLRDLQKEANDLEKRDRGRPVRPLSGAQVRAIDTTGAPGANMTSAERARLLGASQRSPEFVRKQEELGRAAAFGIQKGLKAKRFVDPQDVKKQFNAAFKGAEPEAKTAGAKSMLQWLKGLEGTKGVAKGAAARIAKELGQGFTGWEAEAKKSLQRVDIRNALGSAVGDNKRSIRRMMIENAKAFTGIEKPVKVTYQNVVKQAQAQLDILKEKTKSGSKEQREAAQKEYDRLEKAVKTYLKEAEKATDRFGTAGARSIGKLGPALDSVKGKIGTLSQGFDSLGDSLDDAFDNPNFNWSGDLDATSGTKTKPHRRGGRIRSFRGGGMVPAWVSPGEEIFGPAGNSLGYVPGTPVAADSVFAMLPERGTVITGHGQALMDAGMSLAAATAMQAPHFATGGSIGPARTGQAAYARGLRGQDLVTAIAIAGAESGWKPAATNRNTNGTIDRGLWQINSIHKQYDAGRLFEAGYNAKAMAGISGGGKNWQPWVTYNTGAYRSYLGQARNAAGKAKGGDGTFEDATYDAPIMLGRSKNRPGLVEGAFGEGFSRASGGITGAVERKYGGYRIVPQVREAYYGGTYSRELTAKGGGSAAESGGSLDVDGATPVAGVKEGIGKIAGALVKKFGLTVTSTTGGKHAKNSNHYAGRAVDLAGGRMKEAAYFMASSKNRYGQLLEGIHNPGLSVKNGAKVPQGYWGSKTWNGHKDHIHIAKRRGGRIYRGIRGYADGGKVKAAVTRKFAPPVDARAWLWGRQPSDQNDPLRKLSLGSVSTSKEWLSKLAASVDEATTGYIEQVRKRLQAEANKAGTKASRARLQAALSVIDDRLGARAGAGLYRVEQRAAAFDQNSRSYDALMRIRGMDPSSPEYLRGQKTTAQRFLDTAGASRKDLQQAIRIADRRKDAEGAAQARQALKDFEAQVLDTRASMVDLDKAIANAERQRTEAGFDRKVQLAGFTANRSDDVAALRAQAYDFEVAGWNAHIGGDMATAEDYAIRRAGALQQADQLELEQRREDRRVGLDANDMNLALAGLTDTVTDDISWLQQREQILTGALGKAQAAGDTEDVTAIAGDIRGVRDQIKSLQEQQAAEAAQSEQSLKDLTQELINQQLATQKLIQSQDLASILAGVVSGHIGSSISARSGFPTPVRY